MRKNLLLAALFVGAVSYAQECNPTAELNENFNSFTQGFGPITENCWSGGGTGLVYIDGNEESTENAATFYAMNTPNFVGYLVSPELSTIDGNHELSFDATLLPPTAAGSVTLQLGTLTSATDFGTFVAFGDEITFTAETTSITGIVFPASATQKFIAFKVMGTGTHDAASIDNVVWGEVPATCTAVATLNENFNSFPQGFGPITENCWSGGGTGLVYIDGNDESTENAATFYAMNTPNFVGYLVSPELSTIDGNHELSFDATLLPPTAAGSVTLQLGTLTSATDFETFVAFGDEITFTSETASITGLVFPASDAHRYIAFKVTGTGTHDAASIDNVVWKESQTAGVIDFAKESFAVYPNPSVNKTVTVAASQNGNISIYALTRAKVFEAKAAANSQELNLSNLNAGIYIVKFEAGNATVTKKLVIQ